MGPGLSPFGGGGVNGLLELGGPPGEAPGDRTRRARGDRKRGSDPGGDFKGIQQQHLVIHSYHDYVSSLSPADGTSSSAAGAG